MLGYFILKILYCEIKIFLIKYYRRVLFKDRRYVEIFSVFFCKMIDMYIELLRLI